MDCTELKSMVSLEVLRKSLKEYTKRPDVLVSEDLQVELAASGFEGLLSTVLRVKSSYEFVGEGKSYSKYFIFKKLPKTKSQLHFVRERRMFQKEAIFYGEVIPMMNDLSKGSSKPPVPECYHVACDGMDDVIVMEDLRFDGYRPSCRLCFKKGLDLDHCQLAMSCLGRLHGLGVVVERSLQPEDGGWLNTFPIFAKESWFYEAGEGEMKSPAVNLTANAMKTVLEFSKEIEGLPVEAEATGLLEKAVQGAWSTCCRLVEPDKEGKNVLSHGDYYVNNLLFKYGEEDGGRMKPMEVKAIDLQLARYCHPGIDILFFMYLCTTKSLRDSHLEELLSVYHQSLAVTLEVVDRRPPPITLSELIRDVRGKYKPFGVLVGVVSLPNLFLANEFAEKSFEELFKTGYVSVVREQFAKDPNFRSRMIDLITEFA